MKNLPFILACISTALCWMFLCLGHELATCVAAVVALAFIYVSDSKNKSCDDKEEKE